MTLYEKVTEVLTANDLRTKDIVMAYAYNPPKTYIITPNVLKDSFNAEKFEKINWEQMYEIEKKSFAIFGLDMITQKPWILGIMGDPSNWKIKKDMKCCKEFYKSKLSMQLYKDLMKAQINEAIKGIRDYRKPLSNQLVAPITELFKDEEPLTDKQKETLADLLKKQREEIKKELGIPCELGKGGLLHPEELLSGKPKKSYDKGVHLKEFDVKDDKED